MSLLSGGRLLWGGGPLLGGRMEVDVGVSEARGSSSSQVECELCLRRMCDARTSEGLASAEVVDLQGRCAGLMEQQTLDRGALDEAVSEAVRRQLERYARQRRVAELSRAAALVKQVVEREQASSERGRQILSTKERIGGSGSQLCAPLLAGGSPIVLSSWQGS